jgi:hypothetical protein
MWITRVSFDGDPLSDSCKARVKTNANDFGVQRAILLILFMSYGGELAKMPHFPKCHCLLPVAKHRVQPGCAVEVESMVGFELCDFSVTKDLVASTKEYEQNFCLQQQRDLAQQNFASVKVFELKLYAPFLGWNASPSCHR